MSSKKTLLKCNIRLLSHKSQHIFLRHIFFLWDFNELRLLLLKSAYFWLYTSCCSTHVIGFIELPDLIISTQTFVLSVFEGVLLNSFFNFICRISLIVKKTAITVVVSKYSCKVNVTFQNQQCGSLTIKSCCCCTHSWLIFNISTLVCVLWSKGIVVEVL